MSTAPTPQKPTSKNVPPPPPPREMTEAELPLFVRRMLLARLYREQGYPVPPIADEDPPGAPRPPFDATILAKTEPAETPGRTRLKLALWKHRTTIEVELNADTGELMAWRDPRPRDERGPSRVTETKAIEAAKEALGDELPADCGYPSVNLRETGEVPTYEVHWDHLVGPEADVVVEGDKILVRVNATTGKVHSVFRKWRQVPPTPSAED